MKNPDAGRLSHGVDHPNAVIDLRLSEGRGVLVRQRAELLVLLLCATCVNLASLCALVVSFFFVFIILVSIFLALDGSRPDQGDADADDRFQG